MYFPILAYCTKKTLATLHDTGYRLSKRLAISGKPIEATPEHLLEILVVGRQLKKITIWSQSDEFLIYS
jgi:hypothetical protein